MDLHGHRDDAEELEEYLKEIQMVREQIPDSCNSTRVSWPPHDPSESRVPIDSLPLASAFENLSFGQSRGGGSSGNRSELASMGVESQPYFSPRPSIAGIMDQLLATSAATPHIANQQHNFQSTCVAPDLVGYTVVPPVILSPCVNSFDQYSNLQGDLVTNNLAFPGPIIAAERIVQPRILSPSVNSTNQYSNLQGDFATNNLAFPGPIIVAERVFQPGILSPFVNSTDQYSNPQGGSVTNNLAFPAPSLEAERNAQPGILSPFVNSFDQYSNLQGDLVTNNLAFPGPIIAAERVFQPGILSPFVNSTDQYSNPQGGLVTNNLAFPAPILGAERIVQPGVQFPPLDMNSMDQYSNLGGNLGYGGLILAPETTVQPGSLSPYLRDNIVLARALQSQTDHIQGLLRDHLLRGRHQRAHQGAFVNPPNPTEHQQHETRLHVSGQAHGNRVTVGIGSNSNRPPVSRVHQGVPSFLQEHLLLNPHFNRQPDNITS